MAITKIDGLRQIQDQSLKRELLELDFLKGTNLNLTNSNNDATLGGLAAGTANNDAVNKGQLDAAIAAALSGSMTYKGTIDASDATGATLDGAIVGDFYLVTTAGTLDGIAFNIGDHLVVNTAITDFDVDGAGKIDIVDNTEASDILRTSDIIDDLVTGGTSDVLSAQQGVVIKGITDGLQTELDDTQAGAGLDANGDYTANGAANYISTATSLKNADDLLDAQIKTNRDDIDSNDVDILALQNANANRVFSEVYEPGTNSTTYTVANFPIDAGTLRVYINGIRQYAGAGNDYTVVEATGVITFLETVKGNKDRVVMDYEY